MSIGIYNRSSSENTSMQLMPQPLIDSLSESIYRRSQNFLTVKNIKKKSVDIYSDLSYRLF